MLQTFLGRVRRREPGIYTWIYEAVHRARRGRMPFVWPLGALLYHGRDAWLSAWNLVKTRLVLDPMLRYPCTVGRHVMLRGTMPYIAGDGTIVLGDDVRIGNRSTMIVGLKVFPDARLDIGSRSNPGYMNLISVAKSVGTGNDCLFAGEVKIIDNNSHSLDFEDRRRHAPLEPQHVAPV